MTGSILRPFGPSLYQGRLSDQLIKKMCESITQTEYYGEEWSERLVGKLYQQRLFNWRELKVKQQFHQEVMEHFGHYLDQASKFDKDRCQYHLDHGPWLNIQLAGEHNPLHAHSGWVSAVCYLEVADEMQHGEIAWSWGYETALTRGLHTHRPQAGDIFFWPAEVMHTVYPFQGAGRRVSMAWNIHQNYYP